MEIFESLCTKNNTEIKNFLMLKINNKQEFIPSNHSFNNIIHNNKLSWNEAEKIYDMFMLLNFKPDINNLDILIRYNKNFNNKFHQSILIKIITYLNHNNLDKLISFLLNVHNSSNILNIVVNLINIDNIDMDFNTFNSFLNKSNLNTKTSYNIRENIRYYISNGELINYNSKINKFILKIFNQIIKKYKPTNETLEIVCNYKYIPIFEKLCKMGYIPTQECMYNMVKTGFNVYLLNLLYDHKLFFDDKCFELFIEYIDKNKIIFHQITDILKLLQFYGLDINLSHIEKLFKIGYMPTNLQDFNINYDKKLLDLCYKYNLYNNDYIVNVIDDIKLKKLREYILNINNTKIQEIMDYIDINNIIPDKHCFMLSIKNNNLSNYILSDYIIKKGFKPDINTVIKINDYNYRLKLFDKLNIKN
jgi:hypothetical protein